MASEQDEALRAMAAHRGLKLVKSRRRTPGGDYGRFGLTDAFGAPVLGVGDEGLTASAEEVAAHLRPAMRSDWSLSATSTKARPAARGSRKAPPPPPPPPAPPPPPPRLKERIDVVNLLAKLPPARRREAFTELVSRPGVRIERIVSQGQTTPEDAPMVQQTDEWVMLIAGAARLRIGNSEEATLSPGDAVWIARDQPHWVTWTDPDAPTVWLALHLD